MFSCKHSYKHSYIHANASLSCSPLNLQHLDSRVNPQNSFVEWMNDPPCPPYWHRHSHTPLLCIQAKDVHTQRCECMLTYVKCAQHNHSHPQIHVLYLLLGAELRETLFSVMLKVSLSNLTPGTSKDLASDVRDNTTDFYLDSAL